MHGAAQGDTKNAPVEVERHLGLPGNLGQSSLQLTPKGAGILPVDETLRACLVGRPVGL